MKKPSYLAAAALVALMLSAAGPMGSAAAQNTFDFSARVGDVRATPTGEYFKLVRNAQGRLAWVATTADDPVVANAERVIYVERYGPAIWVDPDGCEHWVLDDGFEGFMSPHLRRDGTPVCNRG